MSKEVRFAAVIDDNAKLVTGKYRNENNINNKLINTSLLQLSSKENNYKNLTATTTFCRYNANYLFYANYLTTAIKRIKKGSRYSINREERGSLKDQQVDLTQIHGILKIAITPLTANSDRYLCIYLESSSPNQEILAKISSAF